MRLLAPLPPRALTVNATAGQTLFTSTGLRCVPHSKHDHRSECHRRAE